MLAAAGDGGPVEEFEGGRKGGVGCGVRALAFGGAGGCHCGIRYGGCDGNGRVKGVKSGCLVRRRKVENME